jgi:two-component system, cell cycle sensor histidine kinase and response regulator CckA
MADDSLSVLVVDEEPAILAFIARILDNSGMRALLARSLQEALGIAQRGYVPIDLILTDVMIPEVSGPELVNRLREIRPEARALYMSAYLDGEIIRIELMQHGLDSAAKPTEDHGLIESIRAASTAPLARRTSGQSSQG